MIPLSAHQTSGSNPKARTLEFDLGHGKTCYLAISTTMTKQLSRGRTRFIERPSSWLEIMQALNAAAQTKPPL
jgi:hypothetical protein